MGNAAATALDMADDFNYYLGDKIGHGNFSDVYKIIDKNDGNEYVGKLINKALIRGIRRDNPSEKVSIEIKILKMLQDVKEVLKYINTINSDDFSIIITEYAKGPNLAELISTMNGNSGLPTMLIIHLLRQLITGIYHIHSKNIVHGDLKPDNIFLAEDYITLKIGGFGNSHIYKSEKYRNNQLTRFTQRYVSPEIINCNNITSKESDIWSIGIILLDMICGLINLQFEKLYDENSIDIIKDYLIHLNKPPEYIGILDYLLCYDKNNRKLINELVDIDTVDSTNNNKKQSNNVTIDTISIDNLLIKSYYNHRYQFNNTIDLFVDFQVLKIDQEGEFEKNNENSKLFEEKLELQTKKDCNWTILSKQQTIKTDSTDQVPINPTPPSTNPTPPSTNPTPPSTNPTDQVPINPTPPSTNPISEGVHNQIKGSETNDSKNIISEDEEV